MIKCENACPRGKFDGCCHKCPDIASECCKTTAKAGYVKITLEGGEKNA